jgi:rhamnose utilization protein RhaD (predicted bifunctional aldolase and dehydrogenase)
LITALTEISRYYGNNPDYVLAGGGNTSWKDDKILYVKSSGLPLADAAPDSFVRMDRGTLARIWNKEYPSSSEEREKAVLEDMMEARMPGEEQKRPSVEALLHDLLPFDFVVHLHPALVNGLTCSKHGEAAMKELFGSAAEAVWIPSTNPGYVLSKAVKTEIDSCNAKFSKMPSIIFLQNHGVFVGDASVDGIKEKYNGIMDKIDARIKRHPDFSDNAALIEFGDGIITTLSQLAGEGGTAVFMRNKEIAALTESRASFGLVESAFTPDHIVYAGSDPLFIVIDPRSPQSGIDGIPKTWDAHVQKTGRKPKIVAVQRLGVFGVGQTEKAANLALELFKDAVKVGVYAESFGGPLFMAPDKIDFINGWEVERFRANVFIK